MFNVYWNFTHILRCWDFSVSCLKYCRHVEPAQFVAYLECCFLELNLCLWQNFENICHVTFREYERSRSTMKICCIGESRRMITCDHPLSAQSHRRAMIWWIETAVQHISVKLVATVFKKFHINMNGCVNFVIFITSFHKHSQTWHYFLFQTCINILDIEHS